ncbi:MAG: hypothetical protein WCH34_16605 [Bacteroidota bacterium]
MENLLIKTETTVLNDTNIALLKRMFNSREKYVVYMNTLWEMREITAQSISITGGYDIKHPNFKIMQLTNDLIGALLQDKYFDQ